MKAEGYLEEKDRDTDDSIDEKHAEETEDGTEGR